MPKQTTQSLPGPLKLLAGAALLGATGIGAYLLYANFRPRRHPALPPALHAERRQFALNGFGQVSYYVDESGQPNRPLVLVHSINAAASAFEMRPLFEHYRGQRPVYVLDLPGYGASDRPARRYTPDLYVAALLAFLNRELSAPADVIAFSLGCEFAAAAALAHPDRVRSLALLSPSGFSAQSPPPASDGVYAAVSSPIWAQGLFDALVTRPSIRYFLGRSFVMQPPIDFMDYAYITARQPGARHAPISFVSGQLFSADIVDRVYNRVAVPTLVLYDKDANVSFDRLPAVLTVNPYWQAQRITPTMGLPHWDALPKTVAALDDFWQDLA